MIDIDALEALAKAAGGDEWTPTYGTRIDQAAIWLPDGDCIAHCFGNIGHHPEPIDADHVAEYIAAANPATILALIAEVRALRDRRNGPGSPTARLHHLIDELDERFPDAIDKYSSAPQDHKYLEAIDAAIARGAK